MYKFHRNIIFYILLIILIRIPVFGQNLVTLDNALNDSITYINSRIPRNTKILILNFTSDSQALSNYICDELTVRIVNDNYFIAVDRSNLASLQRELNFQLSGIVSDATAASVGKHLGAQSIVLGSIMQLGDIYRFQVKIIAVETAMIQGMININISQDPILAALTGGGFRGSQSRWLANQAFGEEVWKNKRFYFGLRPGFSLHFYDLNKHNFQNGIVNNGISFDFATQFSIQLHSLIALQLELIGTAESTEIHNVIEIKDEAGQIIYTNEAIHIYDYQSLLIPVCVKFTMRPDIFMLGLFGGAYFTVPISSINYSNNFGVKNEELTTSPNFGWLAGLNFGMKMGPGVLFLDIRYMSDLNPTKVHGNGNITEIFNRNIVTFGIGYEIGFINRNK